MCLSAAGLTHPPAHSPVQVLEGYIFLGNTTQLGSEITVAFNKALDAAVLAAAQLTIVAHFGGPERAKGVTTLQEALKGMPAHVLRICLSRVCSVSESCPVRALRCES